MAEALISIALEIVGQQLTEIVRQQLSLLAGATRELQKLSSAFRSIQAVLADAETRQVGDQSVQLWLSRLRHAAYDIQDLLEDGRISSLGSSNDDVDGDAGKSVCATACLSSPYACLDRTVSRYKLAYSIKEIRQRLDDIADEKNRYSFDSSNQGGDDRKLVRSQCNQGGDDRMLVRSKRLTTGLIDKSEMFIGRKNDKETMISKLVSGSSHEDPGQVQVVAVVGVGGLGKTTLARQIYHDRRVRDHFNTALYWICVSDVFDVMRLTKAILEQVKKKSTSLSELDALQNELLEALEALEGKRFLLVLDDVWNEDKEKWKQLRLPLNSCAQESRILITTRSQKVAKETMNATHIHDLKGLSKDDSWELFRISAFAEKKPEEYLEFENVGREIANNCNGVPLSIKVIGSAMDSKKTVEDWQNVLDSKIWSLRQARDEILPALLLTYFHLPAYLKQCFAYCCVFPKDWEFQKDVLVRLWVAQGFIQSEGNREKEDIGDEYFDELVARSIFQQVQGNHKGKIICTMHDLLHDLAQFISKHEIYTFVNNSEVGKSEECPGRRIVRHAFLSSIGSYYQPNNCPIASGRAKKLRTLWLNATVVRQTISVTDELFDEARFLRALSLPSSTTLPKNIGKLRHLIYLRLPYSEIAKLPDAIGKMKQLRYLDLFHNLNIVELPESVVNLCNMHTLNLNNCYHLKKLPRGIGKMVSLRHLKIEDTISLKHLPKGLGKIRGLRSLSKFIVGGGDEGEGCGIDELQQLNSLQGSLKIEHLERVSSREEAEKAELWNKQLCSLFLDDDAVTGTIDSVLEGLRPCERLESLGLFGWTDLKLPSWMDRMGSLRKLRFHSRYILEAVPHLPSLEFFDMSGLRNELLPDKGWERLVALQTLRIDNFSELKCLPEGLTQLRSLEDLSITFCGKLESLPVGLAKLKKLKSLQIEHSEVLRCVPDSVGQLESLQGLYIRSCKKLESLPISLGQLKELKALDVRGSEVLRCLPNSLGQLKSLEHLYFYDLEKLESLPQGLRDLSLLKKLEIYNCPQLRERCKREGVDWPIFIEDDQSGAAPLDDDAHESSEEEAPDSE